VTSTSTAVGNEDPERTTDEATPTLAEGATEVQAQKPAVTGSRRGLSGFFSTVGKIKKTLFRKKILLKLVLLVLHALKLLLLKQQVKARVKCRMSRKRLLPNQPGLLHLPDQPALSRRAISLAWSSIC